MMKLATAILGLAVLSSPARAQDGERRERGPEATVNRLRDRLGLSDDQVEKLRAVFRETRDAEEKAQREREDRIREILTDEQKEEYEELRRNPMGGRGGRGPGGGWLNRFMAPPIDQLKRELALTDEQAEKIKSLLDSFTEEVRARFEEMRQGGFEGMDWQEESRKFQERVGQLVEKAKEQLTDEQKTKLDTLMQERFPNRRGGRPPEATRPPRTPADERVRRAMEALKVPNAEEAAVVQSEARKVVEALYALEDFDRESRTKLEELSKRTDASEDEAKARLEEIRTARRELDRALRAAQRALGEVVSYRQELELVRQGLLR